MELLTEWWNHLNVVLSIDLGCGVCYIHPYNNSTKKLLCLVPAVLFLNLYTIRYVDFVEC